MKIVVSQENGEKRRLEGSTNIPSPQGVLMCVPNKTRHPHLSVC